ncbi:MAG: Fic family protein [Candidatus Caccovivens sp.]
MLKKEEYLSFLRKFELVTKHSLSEIEYAVLEPKRKIWINGKPSKKQRFSRFYYFEERDYSELNSYLNDIYKKIYRLRTSSTWKEGMDKVEEIMRGAIYKIDSNVKSECYRANQLYKKYSKKYVKHIYEYYLKNEFDADECKQKWFDAYQTIINQPEFQDFSDLIKHNYITFNTAFQFVFEYAYARKLSQSELTSKDLINFVRDTYSLSSGDGGNPSFRNVTAHIRKANWLALSEDDIQEGMKTWAEWVTDGKENRKYNPIELACVSHCVLVQMQPFQDGNHRLARLVANEFLIENDIPPVYIAFDKREEYNNATNKAIETHDLDDLIDIYYNIVLDSAKEIDGCLDKLLEKQPKEKECSK